MHRIVSLGHIWIIYSTNIHVTSLKRDAFLLLNMTAEFSAEHFILEHLLENATSVTAVRTACTCMYRLYNHAYSDRIFEPTSQVSRRHNPGPNDISPITKVESVFRSHQVRDKIHQICNITSSAHSSQLSFSFYPAKAPQWEESDSVWGKPTFFTLITKTSWCSGLQ